jgi:hypothetical protein
MKSVLVIVTMIVLASLGWGANVPRAATLSQQKMCAEQAAKAFHATASDDTWSFTNHYDAVANICYLMRTQWTNDHKGAASMVYRISNDRRPRRSHRRL